jgi:hypothetical protein
MTLRNIEDKWEEWDIEMNRLGEEDVLLPWEEEAPKKTTLWDTYTEDDDLDLELNDIGVIMGRCLTHQVDINTYFYYKIWKELSLIAERTGTQDEEEYALPSHWNITKDGIGVLRK